MSSGQTPEILLEKILQSPLFRDKDIYKNLLRYLIEADQRDAPPKEVTIACDVFHKDKDFNAAEDTIVRVHMHNLRKKLDFFLTILLPCSL